MVMLLAWHRVSGDGWRCDVFSKGMKGLLGRVVTQPQCGHGVFHAQIWSKKVTVYRRGMCGQ